MVCWAPKPTEMRDPQWAAGGGQRQLNCGNGQQFSCVRQKEVRVGQQVAQSRRKEDPEKALDEPYTRAIPLRASELQAFLPGV